MVVAGPLSLKMIVASLLSIKYSCRCRVVAKHVVAASWGYNLLCCPLLQKPFYVVALSFSLSEKIVACPALLVSFYAFCFACLDSHLKMVSQEWTCSQHSKSSSVRESEGLDESWTESQGRSQEFNKFRKCILVQKHKQKEPTYQSINK